MKYFPSMRVFILKLDGSVEPTSFPLVFNKEKPTREEFRNELTKSPLGAAEKDIFFPGWTHSPFMIQSEGIKDSTPTLEEIEKSKITVDSDEKLHELLEKEELSPGSTALVVQQTRSKRYSRKKEENPSARNNNGFEKARRGVAHGAWADGQRYYPYPTSPPFSPQGLCDPPGPVYFDSPFMHVSLVGAMPTTPTFFPSYTPSPPCYAIPVNVNFAPPTNPVVIPASYQTGQFYNC